MSIRICKRTAAFAVQHKNRLVLQYDYLRRIPANRDESQRHRCINISCIDNRKGVVIRIRCKNSLLIRNQCKRVRCRAFRRIRMNCRRNRCDGFLLCDVNDGNCVVIGTGDISELTISRKSNFIGMITGRNFILELHLLENLHFLRSPK